MAWLLWSDSLALLTTQFIALNERVFQAEDMISSFVGGGHNLIGASNITAILLAFSAGLISFLSPCVLPWCRPTSAT